MSGVGHGGNAIFETGQLAMTASAVPVPLPVFGQATAIVPGQTLLHICAGAVDAYVGNADVSTSTGFRVPANTSKDFFFRQQPYIVAASGTVTYMWEGS